MVESSASDVMGSSERSEESEEEEAADAPEENTTFVDGHDFLDFSPTQDDIDMDKLIELACSRSAASSSG